MRLFNVERAARVFVYNAPVNMGKSFGGLSLLVEEEMRGKPDSGNLFLFLNKRLNYLKVLWYFKGGPCIFAKRLDIGHFEIGDNKHLTIEEMQRIVNHIVKEKE